MMSDKIQYKYRFLERSLPSSMRKQLVLLTGARQTGKTTLSRIKYPELRYINLDAPENREIVSTVSSSLWGRDIGPAILDEAQKEPIIFEKVKYAYDAGDLPFSLILGSSQILLLKKIREALAGRISIYEMWPLLLSELYEGQKRNDRSILLDTILSGENIEKLLSNEPSMLTLQENALQQDAENHLLRWGGMPALLPLSDEERRKWLKDYEYTYLERDLADLARLDDLEPFRKFQKLSALRSGKLLNYSELARDASVSTDTARRYLEYLRISYQVFLLQPYHKNITSSAIKTPKLYWMDVGLLRQLSGFQSDLQGEVFEAMVVAEIIKWIKTAQKSNEIYFYRTRSGLEVDLLIETEKGIIGIEIKSGGKIASRDFRSLKEVALGLSRAWLGGLVIYMGNKIEKLGEPNIWAVPSRRLLI
jgi:predicted AAA+ superfamily ATPase